jgi:diamine N-acetyltransferase
MIRGDKVDLRLIKEKDIELLRMWRNAYHDKFFSSDFITKVQQRQWYSKYAEAGGRDLMFIIQLKDGTPIGSVAIYNIEITTRTADFGRMLIIQEYEGYGYAKEVVTLCVKFAFETLKLWKLKLSVFLDNAKAIGMYSDCGFRSMTRPVMLMEAINDHGSYTEPMELPNWIEEGEEVA